MDATKQTAVSVRDLYVEYKSNNKVTRAVNGVSFTIEKGETLGLVGETGAGKTTTALAMMQLLPDRVSRIAGGSIEILGRDVTTMKEGERKLLRGEIISMIFQDPMTALNPIMTVGDQIRESLVAHNGDGRTREEIDARIDEILTMVGISPQRKGDYPLQFSGGMKQRIVIAIALACSPEVLIADEPTTALDVTIQAQVLALIRDLQQKMGMATLLITHDLGLVVKNCDDVAVMYAGQIVEYGTVEQIFGAGNHHPYTEGLFASIPNLYDEEQRLTPIPGMMPDPTALPEGCNFSPRCPHCMEVCRTAEAKGYVEDGHRIRCHLYGGMNDGIE